MELEALIGSNTVGLLYFPPDYTVPRPGLAGAWRRHVLANAAVRDRAYMEALFRECCPHGALVEVASDDLPADVERADSVVLLYPDSIGIDFGGIERTLRSRWPGKRLLALNGRRRLFRLD